ncbi:MAG: hypothetical protein KC483_03085 [Nitrosarchaeum sp.]|nr:hypothetical protein [Nitrosarchaeum sp.]MCA9820299.1 hypothetical protein [Nitrosarchaeum sp.]MCA9820951.1 hypothetical protein [Nitrosarchaeum sp.]
MVIKKSTKKAAVKRKPASKTVTKKATTKTSSKKPKTKSSKSGKAFGGYAISFAGRKETVEQVFGKTPIAPSQMTKKIWEFVKSKGLSNR